MMASAPSSAGDTSDIHEHYLRHGYVIIPKLVPMAQIDAVLDRYKDDVLPSDRKFYRQNTNVYDRNRLTPFGHVIQSFLDIHNYKRLPGFREAVLDLYFGDELLGALREVTGYATHHLMQSMLFDANAATPPHQDWWYLDTVPAGNLVGAWIAMEDIEEQAGRFFVLPGTQDTHLHGQDMPHSAWLAKIDAYVQANPDKVFTPALRKGDVLFWNSRTMHGSHATQDLQFSRKSLTGHFMPADMTFGNLFTTKPWVNLEQHGEHRYFANQPEYSRKAEIVSRLKQAAYDNPRLLRILRRFQKRSVAEV